MSIDHCAEIVAAGDPERFRTVMAAPVAARRILLPVYALNLEIARAAWASGEPVVGAMRLQWWADRLEDIWKPGGQTPGPGHPVLAAAAPLLRGDATLAGTLGALVEARHWDLDTAPFAGADALADHIDATAGGVMWVAARLLGADRGAEPVVRDVAAAAGLAAWLRAVPALRARGRHPLPAGVSMPDLAAASILRLERARRARARVASAAAPALWPSLDAGSFLREVMRDPARVERGDWPQTPLRDRLRLVSAVLAGRW
jgi:phytoene synthase